MFIQIDYVFSITQSGKVSGDFVVMGPGLAYGTKNNGCQGFIFELLKKYSVHLVKVGLD